MPRSGRPKRNEGRQEPRGLQRDPGSRQPGVQARGFHGPGRSAAGRPSAYATGCLTVKGLSAPCGSLEALPASGPLILPAEGTMRWILIPDQGGDRGDTGWRRNAGTPKPSTPSTPSDGILDYPQSGERFEGRTTISAQRGGHPADRHFTVLRIIGAGDLWVSECIITYDGVPSYSVASWSSLTGRWRTRRSTSRIPSARLNGGRSSRCRCRAGRSAGPDPWPGAARAEAPPRPASGGRLAAQRAGRGPADSLHAACASPLPGRSALDLDFQ